MPANFWTARTRPTSWAGEGGSVYDDIETYYEWNPESGFTDQQDYIAKTYGVPSWAASAFDVRADMAGRNGYDPAGVYVNSSRTDPGTGLFSLGDTSGQEDQTWAGRDAFYQAASKNLGAPIAIPLADAERAYTSSEIPKTGLNFQGYLDKQYANPKIVDVPGLGKFLTADAANSFDWGLGDRSGFFETLFKEILPGALAMYGGMTGLEGLLAGTLGAAEGGIAALGAGGGGAAELASLAEAAATQGGTLGLTGEVAAGLGAAGGATGFGAQDLASLTGIEDPSTWGNLVELTQLGEGAAAAAGATDLVSAIPTLDVAPVSTGWPVSTELPGITGIEDPSTWGNLDELSNLYKTVSGGGSSLVNLPVDPLDLTVNSGEQALLEKLGKDATGEAKGLLSQDTLNTLLKFAPQVAGLLGTAQQTRASKEASSKLSQVGDLQRQVGADILKSFQNGTLNPADLAAIAEWERNAIAQSRQFFAKTGRPDSSAAKDSESNIARKAEEMRSQARQNLLQVGINALNVADRYQAAAIEAEMQGDVAASNAAGKFLDAYGAWMRQLPRLQGAQPGP